MAPTVSTEAQGSPMGRGPQLPQSLPLSPHCLLPSLRLCRPQGERVPVLQALPQAPGGDPTPLGALTPDGGQSGSSGSLGQAKRSPPLHPPGPTDRWPHRPELLVQRCRGQGHCQVQPGLESARQPWQQKPVSQTPSPSAAQPKGWAQTSPCTATHQTRRLAPPGQPSTSPETLPSFAGTQNL